MGGLAPGGQAQPQAAFVRGDQSQPGWFADDGQIGPQRAVGQCARAGLRVFLIHQACKNQFRGCRPRPAARQNAQRRQHRRHRTFGVASAAPVKPPVTRLRNKLVVGKRRDGVQVRREEDALFDFSRRRQARDQVGAAGRGLLPADVQSGAGRGVGQKLRHPSFPGVGLARRQESGVDAGQRHQVAQQFFGARHMIKRILRMGAWPVCEFMGGTLNRNL